MRSLNGSYYCLMDSQVVEFYCQIELFNELMQKLRTVTLTDGKNGDHNRLGRDQQTMAKGPVAILKKKFYWNKYLPNSYVTQLSSYEEDQMIHKSKIDTVWAFKKSSSIPGLAQ